MVKRSFESGMRQKKLHFTDSLMQKFCTYEDARKLRTQKSGKDASYFLDLYIWREKRRLSIEFWKSLVTNAKVVLSRT